MGKELAVASLQGEASDDFSENAFLWTVIMHSDFFLMEVHVS